MSAFRTLAISMHCLVNVWNVESEMPPTGAYRRGYKGICGFIPPKLDLIDTEYIANLVNVNDYVTVNVQQCSLLDGYAIPA